MSAEKFIVGPRWGLGRTIAHPSEKVSPSMTSRIRSILHDIPKNAWGEVAAWTVGKKTTRILILGNTQPTPGQLLILSLRGISSLSWSICREKFSQNI